MDAFGESELTLIRRKRVGTITAWRVRQELTSGYLTYPNFDRLPTVASIIEGYLRQYFAAKRVQRRVVEWLGRPHYSNGKTGLYARNAWRDCQQLMPV